MKLKNVYWFLYVFNIYTVCLLFTYASCAFTTVKYVQLRFSHKIQQTATNLNFSEEKLFKKKWTHLKSVEWTECRRAREWQTKPNLKNKLIKTVHHTMKLDSKLIVVCGSLWEILYYFETTLKVHPLKCILTNTCSGFYDSN